MKTIRGKILVPTVALIATALLVVGGIASYLNYKSTFSTLEQTMTQTVAISTARVEHNLKEYVNIALETGSIARLANPETKLPDKKAIIDQRSKSYQFESGGILDMQGRDIFTQTDYRSMEFFQEALKGVHHISEPMILKQGEPKHIVLSAPLWEGGIPNTKVVGVTYFIPSPTFLSDIVTSINISAGGGAYVIDANGFTIAHQDNSRVEKDENIFEVAKQTPALAPLSAIHMQMTQGQTDFSTYSFDGVSKFVAYAPIGGTHGWSMAINAPINDFMAETFLSIFIVVVLLVVFLLLGSWVAYLIASRISKPVIEIAKAAESLAGGNLKVQVTYESHDELGKLATDVRQLCSTVVGIIQGMNQELGAMSNGDFTVEPQGVALYVGDFAALRKSLDHINSSLSDTLTQISTAADQVATGSDQVSSSAQSLSQGATEQASSIEVLSATINQISAQIHQTAQNTQAGMETTTHTGRQVDASNNKMQLMISAMNDISGKSAQIGKIIKTIEDIAFQTNILALNAAVEAARAGAAGKGFAVVADEVRNLAGKSAEAAKNTTALIEETVRAVENGTKIVDSTAEALGGVVVGAQQVLSIIHDISEASATQANSITQATTGLDLISSVVQQNSATAEESAAASEQLSGQAQMLKNLTGQFKLKQDAAQTRKRSF